MTTDSMTRPCPNGQCPNFIDFTEVECTTCWDARPLSERLGNAMSDNAATRARMAEDAQRDNLRGYQGRN